MKFPIYLDNHATTPVDPRVLDAMLPYLTEHFGNPSSTHGFGLVARQAVETAREQVAALIGARPDEIIFTSGATESNNLAIRGCAEALRGKGRHIVTVATEHKAVLDCVAALTRDGWEADVLPVGPDGLLEPGVFASAIRPDTVLASVMMANNETGVLQPIAELGSICREKGVLFHTDAAQAVGKVPVDVAALHVDLLSISGHKIYAPKGVGALWIRARPRVPVRPLLEGGGHERGLRSGTLNAAGIVALGAACDIAQREMPEEAARIANLRDALWSALSGRIPGVRLNAAGAPRLPGNLNVSFEGIEGESLMIGLDQVALSSSSACTSGLRLPSHVLKAMGLSDELAFASIRFGVGRFNTREEIDWVARRTAEVVESLRALRG